MLEEESPAGPRVFPIVRSWLVEERAAQHARALLRAILDAWMKEWCEAFGPQVFDYIRREYPIRVRDPSTGLWLSGRRIVRSDGRGEIELAPEWLQECARYVNGYLSPSMPSEQTLSEEEDSSDVSEEEEARLDVLEEPGVEPETVASLSTMVSSSAYAWSDIGVLADVDESANCCGCHHVSVVRACSVCLVFGGSFKATCER